MDSEKCKALICVLESGSISNAALKLGYTPSGISRMIASMEEEVGFSLLVRSRRGIVPTDTCQQLLPMIREMSFWGGQYLQMATQIRGGDLGEIRIGTSYRAYYPWLTQIMTKFAQSYPKIKVHLIEGNSSELTAAMARRELDFCIISHREGNFTWIPLEENPIVAWLPQNHPNAALEAYPLTAFETDCYIETYPGQNTDNARIFKKNHIKPNGCYSTTDNFATYSMVEAGLGVSLNNGLNAEGWSGNVVIKPLEPPQQVMIGIALPELDVLSPAAKRFVALVKKGFDI